MTKTKCILSVDQGTSSTKSLLFGLDAQVHEVSTLPVELDSPKAGWVQQDPGQILESVENSANSLVSDKYEILGLSISNQRESALAWDRESGKALSKMLGWQDRRTAEKISSFSAEQKKLVRSISGLPLDPMFSALKFAWILDEVDKDRSLSRAGKIALGTVDSWIVYRLTGEHVVEMGNASRTQLLDVKTGTWSKELLDLFNIPLEALPKVVASNYRTIINASGPLAGLPILSVMADSHASLYAHLQTSGAGVKATFGTGSSVMALSQKKAGEESGLVSTIAWADGSTITHAVEGNILSSGATIVWLSKLFGIDSNALANLAEQRLPTGISAGLLNFVPAFGGLGAPWWDVEAHAIIDGMTLDTDIADIALAGFEAICLQIEDVLSAIETIADENQDDINVDGGPTANKWLMQLMANISSRKISVNPIAELSAVGTALYAVKAAGFELTQALKEPLVFHASARDAGARKNAWQKALQRSRLKNHNN